MEQHQRRPDVPAATVPPAQTCRSFSPTVPVKRPGFHPGLELPLVGTGKPVMAPQISEGCNRLPGAALAAGCSPWLVNQTVKAATAVRGEETEAYVPDMLLLCPCLYLLRA